MNGKSDETKQYLQFARLLISGSGITEAYRKVFDCKKMTDSAVYTAASRFARNVNILKILKELREAKDEATEMTLEWRMVLLSRKAEEAAMKGDWKNLIKIIDMLNRMDGTYGLQRVEEEMIAKKEEWEKENQRYTFEKLAEVAAMEKKRMEEETERIKKEGSPWEEYPPGYHTLDGVFHPFPHLQENSASPSTDSPSTDSPSTDSPCASADLEYANPSMEEFYGSSIKYTERKKLTEKQREFARLIALGRKKSDAYHESYDCKGKSEGAVRAAASRLAKRKDITNLVRYFREKALRPSVMPRERRIALLREQAKELEKGDDIHGFLRIIDLLNRTEGSYERQRQEVKKAQRRAKKELKNELYIPLTDAEKARAGMIEYAQEVAREQAKMRAREAEIPLTTEQGGGSPYGWVQSTTDEGITTQGSGGEEQPPEG